MPSNPRVCQRQHRRQWITLWGALFALVLVLSACGGASATSTSPSATPTASDTSSIAGNYIMQANGVLAAVSTDGHQFVAYVCNGNPTNPLTFSEWFHGPLTGTHTILNNADGANLDLFLHPFVADGQLTLKDGTRYWFAAAPVRDPGDPARFVRAEQTINGVKYLAGWIIPSTVEDENYAGYTLSHAYHGALATISPNTLALPARDSWCWWDCQGGAIRNEQTGALTRPPQLSDQDLASRQANVSNIGVFHLTICNLAVCS